MDRPNIFEALNIAREEHWSPVDSPTPQDTTSDGENAAPAATLDQDAIGLIEGEDLTDEDEPNVIENEEAYREDASANENDADYVPHSDMEDDEAEDFPYLADEIANLRQRRAPGRQRIRREQDNGHLEELMYTAKDGTKWSSVPPPARPGRTPNENVCHAPASQLVGCSDVTEPCDAFSLFFSRKMVKSIVKYTNLEGKRQRGDAFQETNEVEIKGFLACVLYMGAMRQSMLSLQVAFDPADGLGLIRAITSRKRFLQLSTYIRFDDRATRTARRSRDVFAPFREFWDDFSHNLTAHYKPGPYITIDEQLVPFRGRCSFLQYLPSKPDRYGLKIFWAVDVENNFPLVSEPYLGRPLGAQRQQNLGRNMALRLSTPFFKTGRNITADNYFTDKELSDTLLANGLTLVGTVRANKRFLPEPFKQKRGQQVHASTFAFQEKTTLVNYQSKADKNVVVLSTYHREAEVDPEAPKRKPDMVRFYNATKGAVDALDKMAHAFSTKKTTKRWPMVLFYNTIDLAAIAARVIWKLRFPGHALSMKNARHTFLLIVAKQLAVDHLQSRLAARNLSKELHQVISSQKERIAQEVAQFEQMGRRQATPLRKRKSCHDQAPGAKRRQNSQGVEQKSQGSCSFCDWRHDRKTRSACYSCHNWVCKDHLSVVCPDCRASIESSDLLIIQQ